MLEDGATVAHAGHELAEAVEHVGRQHEVRPRREAARPDARSCASRASRVLADVVLDRGGRIGIAVEVAERGDRLVDDARSDARYRAASPS